MHLNHEADNKERIESRIRGAQPKTNGSLSTWPRSPKSWEPPVKELLRDQFHEWQTEAIQSELRLGGEPTASIVGPFRRLIT